MRKSLTSGLVLLLPVILTIVIVNFFINFLTHPFLESTKNMLAPLKALHPPFLLFHHSTVITFLSKILILIMLSGFVILIGLLGKLFLIDSLFRFGDRLLQKLPFINKIYKASQDAVSTLFSSSSKKFSKVVLAPFPNNESLCIGFVANEDIRIKNCLEESEKLISVFIPGTPNPTVGFILLFKREQVLFVDMTVEEAMKFILSCGIVMPDFKIMQPHEGYEKQLFY